MSLSAHKCMAYTWECIRIPEYMVNRKTRRALSIAASLLLNAESDGSRSSSWRREMDLPQLEELILLHANICRALAEPKRILILYSLNERPRHVSALAEYLNIPQPTVSRHLRILRQQSLVITERVGPSVVYRVADHRIIDVLDTMRQVLYDSMVRRSELLNTGLSA